MTSEPSPRSLYAAGCEVFDFDENGDLDIHDFAAFGIVLDGRPLPFDFDSDGDVDLADYGRFHACFNGPGPWPTSKACFPGDFDRDNDLDLTDLADLLNYFGLATIVPVPANPYYFTGRELDFDIRDGNGAPVLALYHYRARAYDPWHGRFWQRDSLLYKDSLNIYQYVRSNPVLWQDPTGQFALPNTGSATLFGIELELSLSAASLSLSAAIKALIVSISLHSLEISLVGITIFGAQDPAVLSDLWGQFDRAFEDLLQRFASDSSGNATANTGSGPGASGAGGDPWKNWDDKTFRRWLESIENVAANTGGQVTRSLEQTQRVYDELLRRGWYHYRGVETYWQGGPHINMLGPNGETLHLPVPWGFQPNLPFGP